MATFQVHTKETASPAGRERLEHVEKTFGFIPNAFGVMAEAPTAIDAYLAGVKALMESSFTPTERHAVWFTINSYHSCHYCMAAHTGAAKGEKIPQQVIDESREGGAYSDERLEALRRFTVHLLDERGWANDAEVDAFLAAGFTRQQVLEVVTAISHKTLTNYMNHLALTPLDEPFQPHEWEAAATV